DDPADLGGAREGCFQGQGGHLRRIESDAVRDGDVFRWSDMQLVRGDGVELGLAEVEARRGRAKVGVQRTRGDAEADRALACSDRAAGLEVLGIGIDDDVSGCAEHAALIGDRAGAAEAGTDVYVAAAARADGGLAAHAGAVEVADGDVALAEDGSSDCPEQADPVPGAMSESVRDD